MNPKLVTFARAWCLGAVLSVATLAVAQTAAPAQQKASAAAPVAAAPAADAKAPPALPAGSTAAVGWNNPPKWSEVEGKPQYASVPGHETNVLVEDKGHWWRTIRNGPVTFYGGILLLLAPALLLVFYMVKGPVKLHDKPTGRLIERFNSAERMAHWTMAVSFVLMAITGMSILFGKYVLLPVIGADLFSWFTSIGKNIHNFVGPLFIFSIVVSFFIYVKDNFFTAGDFTWLAKFGGMFGEHEIPSGRFNGGEKVWFWMGVVFMGIVVGASGVIMLFPNWNTARELMAEANLVHATAAVLFACMAFAHIYLGVITEGAYQGMREGYVDETWAKEHHELWYEEVKAGKVPHKMAAAAQPAAGDD